MSKPRGFYVDKRQLEEATRSLAPGNFKGVSIAFVTDETADRVTEFIEKSAYDKAINTLYECAERPDSSAGRYQGDSHSWPGGERSTSARELRSRDEF